MNFRKMLSELDGKVFDSQQLYKELKKIRSNNYRELPIEFKSEDLFDLAWSKGWVTLTKDGFLSVKLVGQLDLFEDYKSS